MGNPSENEVDPLSKPLPSVDIPILRGDIRAKRARVQAVLFLAGLFGFVALAYLAYGWWTAPDDAADAAGLTTESDDDALAANESGDDESDAQGASFALAPKLAIKPEIAEEDEPTIEAPQPTIVDGGAQRFTTTFGEARGFRPALLNAGLSNEESASIEVALTGVVDFRRCQPEHEIIYERDENDRLRSFRYVDHDTSYGLVTRSADGGFTGERRELPSTTETLALGGVVHSSLGDAISALGLGRSVVGTFVEVFGAKVNFATQAREGDLFRVVVDRVQVEGREPTWGQLHALEYVGQRAGRLRAYYFAEEDRPGDWYDADGRQMRGSWLRVPCQYERISSPFNPRRMHPILRRISPHNGVDLAAATGTPVIAAAEGRVTWAGPKGPNGNLVMIEHEGGYISAYAHLHQIQRGIRAGVEVAQRQQIGTVGTTGRSTGPHLHFGLKHHGNFINPLDVLNGPGRLLPSAPRNRFRQRARRLQTQLDSVQLGPEPAHDPSPEGDDPEEEALD